MNKKYLALMMGAMVAGPAFARNADVATTMQDELANDPIIAGNLSVASTVNVDTTFAKNSEDDYKESIGLSRTNLRIGYAVSDAVRFNLKLQLENLLIRDQGESASTQQELDEFVREANIEFRPSQGVAILVGKQAVPFGLRRALDQYLSNTLLGDSSSTFALRRQEEVFGIVVKLPNAFAGMDISASIFEAKAGDLDISTDAIGAAIKAERKITENLTAAVSYMFKSESEYQEDSEHRLAIGGIYKTEGGFEIYGEALVVKDNITLPEETTFGATVGVGKELGVGTLRVEGSWMQELMQSVGVSYQIPVTEAVTVEAMALYEVQEDQDWNDGDVRFGVRLAVELGDERVQNKNPMVRGADRAQSQSTQTSAK